MCCFVFNTLLHLALSLFCLCLLMLSNLCFSSIMLRGKQKAKAATPRRAHSRAALLSSVGQFPVGSLWKSQHGSECNYAVFCIEPSSRSSFATSHPLSCPSVSSTFSHARTHTCTPATRQTTCAGARMHLESDSDDEVLPAKKTIFRSGVRLSKEGGCVLKHVCVYC